MVHQKEYTVQSNMYNMPGLNPGFTFSLYIFILLNWKQIGTVYQLYIYGGINNYE